MSWQNVGRCNKWRNDLLERWKQMKCQVITRSRGFILWVLWMSLEDHPSSPYWIVPVWTGVVDRRTEQRSLANSKAERRVLTSLELIRTVLQPIVSYWYVTFEIGHSIVPTPLLIKSIHHMILSVPAFKNKPNNVAKRKTSHSYKSQWAEWNLLYNCQSRSPLKYCGLGSLLSLINLGAIH